MRKGLLVPLGISVVLHVVVIGVGELISSPEKGSKESSPSVSYDISDPESADRPAAGDSAVPAPAGIEGSISLETANPRYRPYFNALRRSIEKNWRAPSPLGGAVPSGKLDVLFVLGRSGKLLEISVNRSSGKRELDFSAVESVKKAAPFEPFPSDIADETLPVKARFVYD